jgi:hypothetical protein
LCCAEMRCCVALNCVVLFWVALHVALGCAASYYVRCVVLGQCSLRATRDRPSTPITT